MTEYVDSADTLGREQAGERCDVPQGRRGRDSEGTAQPWGRAKNRI